jgi:choline-sulfatase
LERRPNILFLMTDEHRADVTGYAGNDIVRTPVLDKLARTGVVFGNAYTPSPACIPARQCMMSGQLSKTCHCEGWMDLVPGYMTFARLFTQHAYETVAFGKLHHQGPDQLQGWLQRPVCPPDLLLSRFVQDRSEEDYARYQRPYEDYLWPQAKEVKRASVGQSQAMIWDNLAVEGALSFIEEYFTSPYYDREHPHKPLLLKVSMVQPHYPYLTDRAKFTYYLNRVLPYLDQEVSTHPVLSRFQVRQGVDASEREIRRATAAYYGMIETIDTHYGRVLDALRHVDQDPDDWIVIYLSDHGEMLGQHAVWEKQKFYEGSVRVPLVIRWPRRFRERRVVSENVNLCDLFATLCDLVSIPTPPGLDSRSLVPLLEGDSSGWDNETVSQFNDTDLMIKRDHLKYQYYGPDRPEVLFDLERNPGETVNYIDDPAYADAVAAFRLRCAELGHGPNADPRYVNAGYS